MKQTRSSLNTLRKMALLVLVFAGLYSSGAVAGDLLGFITDLQPRVLSIILLPFLFVLFVVLFFLKKKYEQRKWDKVRKDIRKKKNTAK